MEDKKTDLRIIKTKANIKREFMTLLQKKPVEKITVTELSKAALINKGTFYLHYQDIYELYEDVVHDELIRFCDSIDFYGDFFNAPDNFASKMVYALNNGSLKDKFPYYEPFSTKLPVPFMITQEIKRRLYALNVLEPSIENDIKLDLVLNGLFVIGFQYGRQHNEEAAKICAQAIQSLILQSPQNRENEA